MSVLQKTSSQLIQNKFIKNNNSLSSSASSGIGLKIIMNGTITKKYLFSLVEETDIQHIRFVDCSMKVGMEEILEIAKGKNKIELKNCEIFDNPSGKKIHKIDRLGFCKMGDEMVVYNSVLLKLAEETSLLSEALIKELDAPDLPPPISIEAKKKELAAHLAYAAKLKKLCERDILPFISKHLEASGLYAISRNELESLSSNMTTYFVRIEEIQQRFASDHIDLLIDEMNTATKAVLETLHNGTLPPELQKSIDTILKGNFRVGISAYTEVGTKCFLTCLPVPEGLSFMPDFP